MSMNEQLPKDLAGWQHLAPDEIVKIGDLLAVDGIPECFANATIGWTVGATEDGYTRVYRRIPVAKQGDLDHKRFPAQPKPPLFPSDPAKRKRMPIATGVLDYFPRALAAVAECSVAGNKQHHDGTPLHWDKSKSTDEADALVRHLIDRGTVDSDGIRHSAKCAWRALALLERELEAEASKQ